MTSDPERSMRTFRLMAHLTGCGLVLAIAASAGVFVYRPVMADQRQLDHEIETTQEFLSQGASLKTESQQLKEYLREMERRFEEAVTRIPETARETEFLGQLTELAAQSGLKMRDFRPGNVVERLGYQELAISISADADYSSLCRFLHGLRNLDRLCQVASLNVNDNSGSSGDYPVIMTVAVFFAPLKSDAGTGDDHVES